MCLQKLMKIHHCICKILGKKPKCLGRTHGRTDVRTDGRTMWKQYTPPQTKFAGSITTDSSQQEIPQQQSGNPQEQLEVDQSATQTIQDGGHPKKAAILGLLNQLKTRQLQAQSGLASDRLWFISVFESTAYLKFVKLQCFLWFSLSGDYRVTDEALLAETT